MSATSSFVAISASASTSTVKPPLAKSHTTIHDSRHAKQSRPQAPALPSHPQTSHGTRSKLIDLLPISRHALFHARVTIHQLWNVPLVHGSFGVKWKFQGVHSATSAKLKLQEAMDSLKGKEKDVLDALDEHHQHPSSTRSIYTSGSSNLSAPSLSAPSLGSSSSNSSNNKPSLPPSPNSKERCIIDFKSESRGRTEFVKLQDHNVKWGHSVDVAVQMSINRETQELQPSELKLVVMQDVVPGDPDAPSNPRLGAVYLNLAEYVDEGPVTRRYLLRQSKTNATLQLTIELKQISGETNYKSPPLPKGEIMAGISSLLDHSSYRNVTIERSSYLRTSSNVSTMNALGPDSPVSPDVGVTSASALGFSTGLSTPTTPGRTRSSSVLALSLGVGSRSGSFTRVQSPTPGLDPSLRTTTDNLIEAIFNPVPTSSKSASPFTYYVAPPPPSPTPVPTPGNASTPALPLSQRADSIGGGCASASASINGSYIDIGGDGSLKTGNTASISTHSNSQHSHSHSQSESRSSSSCDGEFGIVAPSRSGSLRSARSQSTSNSNGHAAQMMSQSVGSSGVGCGRKWWQRIGTRSQASVVLQPQSQSQQQPQPQRSHSRPRPKAPSLTKSESNRPVSPVSARSGQSSRSTPGFANTTTHIPSSVPNRMYVTMDDEDVEPVSGLESVHASAHGHGHGHNFSIDSGNNGLGSDIGIGGNVRRRGTARSLGTSSVSSTTSGSRASRWAAAVPVRS